MKKYAAILCILAMIGGMAGCCTRVDPTTQVSSKSFGNCLTNAQQLLCNPTAAQQQEAAAILAFLTSGVQIASIFVPIPITVPEVTAVFSAVQQGGCVLTTELQQAVDWYNALVAILKQPASAGKVKAGVAPPPIPNIQQWLNSTK